jgi:hypothetical protein
MGVVESFPFPYTRKGKGNDFLLDLFLFVGYIDYDMAAITWGGGDGGCAAEDLCTVPYVGEAQTFFNGVDVETFAVVYDFEEGFEFVVVQFDGYVLCLGVLDNVVQLFLNDPEGH